MSKLVVALVLGFSGLIAGVALSLDNSARPTPAQDDVAYEEWHEMDPYAREIVCDIFEQSGSTRIRASMIEDGLNEGEIRARLDLMERECK